MQIVAHSSNSRPNPTETAQRRDAATTAFYRKNAAEYFDRTYHLKMDHLYAPFLAYVPERGRILDVGSGSGRDVKAFREKGYEAFGIDSSPELVELARENVGPYFQEARLESLKVEKLFDAVWACASLLHLPRFTLHSALLNFKQALKFEGVLFATVQRGVGDCVQADGRYYSYYETQEIRDAAEEAGFDVISAWESADTLRSVGGPTWINVLARLVRR